MELEALSKICHEYGMRLFVDGVRLAYALLAKGRMLGFSSDCLYEHIGVSVVRRPGRWPSLVMS